MPPFFACVYTNDLKKLDSKLWRSEGVRYPAAGRPTVKSTVCGLVYVCTWEPRTHSSFPYVAIYLAHCAFAGAESARKCTFPLQRERERERESSRIPLGVPQDIWLRIDGLNLRLKRTAEPLGAAALHIITSLLWLRLELGRNPIVWFMGLQICCVSFYATSSPGPASHLLQIRRQCV